MKTSDYLDKAKEALKLESDYALAKALQEGKQSISRWRRGDGAPDAVACHKIARAIGIDPVLVIADIGSQHERDESRANYWREIVKNYGRAAVWILVIVAITSNTLFFASPAQAAQGAAFRGGAKNNIHYATF